MTRTGTQVTLKQNLRFTEKRASLAAPAIDPLNTYNWPASDLLL